MKVFSFLAPKRVLVTIACLFLLSGLIRIGTVSFAVAKDVEPEQMEPAATASRDNEYSTELVEELLQRIAARTKDLDAREQRLRDREAAVDLAEQLVERNLAKLEQAEASLQATIAQVDGASEGDLEQLTRMYASMKPKIAAQLFEEMTPDFAAGFLGRMPADAAGGIMSGLSAGHAYAISVVLAGRNASAPQD